MTISKETRLCGVRLNQSRGTVKLSGFYRGFIGRRDGLNIWIVDGSKVATDLYAEWIMGGNDQRYRFNPLDEVWIDDRLGCDELEYTVAHELLEVGLMRENRFTYERAHNCSLDLEKTLRDANSARSERAHRKLSLLQSERKLPGLKGVDMESLKGLYRVHAGRSGKASIWIVDGGMVRQHIDPNFWAGANGMMATYVPRNQIWLDASTSALESYFALRRQKLEFNTINGGSSQRRAYELALLAELNERERQARLRAEHEASLEPVRYGARDRGVKR